MQLRVRAEALSASQIKDRKPQNTNNLLPKAEEASLIDGGAPADAPF